MSYMVKHKLQNVSKRKVANYVATIRMLCNIKHSYPAPVVHTMDAGALLHKTPATLVTSGERNAGVQHIQSRWTSHRQGWLLLTETQCTRAPHEGMKWLRSDFGLFASRCIAEITSGENTTPEFWKAFLDIYMPPGTPLLCNQGES